MVSGGGRKICIRICMCIYAAYGYAKVYEQACMCMCVCVYVGVYGYMYAKNKME